MNIHSIRAKITAITIAAILTTVVAIFVAGYSTVEVENEHRAAELMNHLAGNTAATVEQYLDTVQHCVEAVASMADKSLDSVVLIKNGAAGRQYTKPGKRTKEQNEAIDSYLSEYCEDLQKSFESFAGRTYGTESYFYCINPEISKNVHGFYYTKTGKTGYVRQTPLDASKLDPSDQEHNAWYYAILQKGRPAWVGPYLSNDKNKWICSYVIPVYKAGMLIGVLGLDIPVEILASQLSDVGVYDTGYVCLFSEDGRVIYHPEAETGFIPEEDDRVISEEQLTHDSNGDELISYNYNGTEYQMAYCRLANGMTLIVKAPEKEITASWNNLFHMLIIITVLVVAIFAFLVFFAMGLITQPLKDLTDASQRLAGGDYDVELNYDKNDELGVLTRAFTTMRDKLKKSIDDLNHRLFSDSLTNLPNMRFFFSLAEIEKKRLAANGREPVLLYIDLIGMKHYNVRFGFEEGDRLLCEIGSIVEAQFGRKCMCRYGDDHFAAITDADGLNVELDLLLENCRYANNGKSLPVSVGIYPYSLGDVSVSVACDRAKYACDSHRGVFESGYYRFDRSMLRQAENTRYIISHLDEAIRRRWIKVYYQPIVSAESGKVCDEEALSRWIDPEMGFMSPEDFIPVLETARLIYKLDLFVLDRIIEKIRDQEKKGIPTVPHSLNLSRSDFESCDIVEEIRKRIDKAGIPHEMLTIEVTESMIGSDFDFMKKQIERFRALGFEVWMDDFGSGYSSLDVLQNIHFDLLKFDMSFLKRGDGGNESRIILRELTVMARELGIETLCEGVETEEQADFLKGIGCSKLQGYLYSKPIPYDEIVRLYRNGSHFGYEELSNCAEELQK